MVQSFGSRGRHAPLTLVSVLVCLNAAASSAQTEDAKTPEPPKEGHSTKFFPIPMYTTVPNEGSTYGLMPVIVRVAPSGEISSIFAPSISWNSAAGVNGTLRYYRYPRPELTWSIIAAASTHINRTLLLQYDDRPVEPGRITINLFGQARRNLFYRYFGLGPDSLDSGESSYTRTTVFLDARAGVNLTQHLNAGLRTMVRSDQPKENAIYGLPALQVAHPDAPGIDGAGAVWTGASVRYDDRAGREYAAEGIYAELAGDNVYGWKGVDQFWRLAADLRLLIDESKYLQGGGRVSWSQALGGSGSPIPFYYLSSLGGELMMRGFPEDRFFDRGAWTIEIEQRIRLLRTRLFGVTADWRVDPFVSIGQVYPRIAEIFDHIRYSVGLGFRVWVHPNVLGRVDLGYGGEGIQAYVVLGYPF